MPDNCQDELAINAAGLAQRSHVVEIWDTACDTNWDTAARWQQKNVNYINTLVGSSSPLDRTTTDSFLIVATTY